MLSSIAIGIGLLAPLGNLSTVLTTGKELRVAVQIPTFPQLEFTTLKIIAFAQDELNINIVQITEGAKLHLYKRINITAGVGGYYIRKTAGTGVETNYGSCSCFGAYIPIAFSRTVTISPELSYYSVPQSIALTINLQLNL